MTGFKGDWKGIKQVLNFSRYADKDEVGCSIKEISIYIYSKVIHRIR